MQIDCNKRLKLNNYIYRKESLALLKLILLSEKASEEKTLTIEEAFAD